MPKKFSSLSRDEKRNILKLAQQGLPTSLISEVVERSMNAVYDALREFDVPARRSAREAPEGVKAISRGLDALRLAAGTTDDAFQSPTELHVCLDCGNPWELDSEHAEWFQQKRLDIPRRCEDCRKRRKTHHTRTQRLGAGVESLRSLREALSEAVQSLDEVIEKEVAYGESQSTFTTSSSAPRWGSDMPEDDFKRS